MNLKVILIDDDHEAALKFLKRFCATRSLRLNADELHQKLASHKLLVKRQGRG